MPFRCCVSNLKVKFFHPRSQSLFLNVGRSFFPSKVNLSNKVFRSLVTGRDHNTATRYTGTDIPQQQQQHAGLFSIPELQQPSDFSVLSKQAIEQCNKLRSTVAATVSNGTLKSFTDTLALLHQLDDISKSVCNVIDPAELCRSVHADEKWRQAASEAFAVLSDFIALLNSDTTLYQALQLVTQSEYYQSNDHLSEEEKRFAFLLQAEFERDGIHLPDTDREKVRDIQHQITELESSFGQNLVYSEGFFPITESAAVTQIIPMHVLKELGAKLDDNQRLHLNNNDCQISQTLLKYSDNPALRKQVFHEHMTAVPENLIVLDELVRTRHELALLQGFPSYVERNLMNKMAGSAETVQQFLYTSLEKNKAPFKNVMETLSDAKLKEEGSAVLEPWDIAYYTGLLSARDGDMTSTVSQHMSLSTSIQAMQMLVDRLFGISMQEDPMIEAERWDCGIADISAELRIRKFSFTDPHGEPLGTMFLDLLPRPGKYGHAAHFTVRCGCALNYATSNDAEVEYQRPIVALVCNLASTGEGILNHSEAETLFHEFGHALHSLLSRTKFQHMSGTRAAMDFVETPSHWMEQFVWDPSFLRILTNSKLSDEVLSQFQRSRHRFSAYERQNQIIYGLFDQKLFGRPTGLAPKKLFTVLHKQNNIPYLSDTHWYSRFGHLVSYGGGYYGYLYSQMFARDIWNTCFAKNSLSRDAGERMWHKLLVHGGARDPGVMLKDLLGRDPIIDYSI